MVELIRGKRELIGIGKESVYGTAVVPTIRFGRNAEWIPDYEEDMQEIPAAGTDTLTSTFDYGDRYVSGELRYNLQNWEMFTFVIGTTTNTDGGGGVYTHTFSRNTDKSLPSFTIQRAAQASTDYVEVIEGCQINACTLSWDASSRGGRGKYISCSLSILGEDVDDSTTTTSVVAPTSSGFLSSHVILTLNSVSKSRCVKGTLSINNNLNEARYAIYAASSNYLKKESVPQKIMYSGEFTLEYTDATEFNLATARAVVGGTNTIVFQRGTNDTMTGTFTNLRVFKLNNPTNLDGVNQCTLIWIADDISFVAVDSRSDYIT